MTSLENGFVYYFILFGVGELISNLYHLAKRSNEKRSESSKKQHQEIPSNLTPIHYVVKAIIMMVFGILFLSCGIIILLSGKFLPILFYSPLLLFSFYSLIQAIIYKNYWRVWSALVVYNLPLIIFITLH